MDMDYPFYNLPKKSWINLFPFHVNSQTFYIVYILLNFLKLYFHSCGVEYSFIKSLLVEVVVSGEESVYQPQILYYWVYTFQFF